MSKKQNTRSGRKQSTASIPHTGKPRGFRYFLTESQLTSVQACEELKNELENDGAKNLKVYVGEWRSPIPDGPTRNTIKRKEHSKLLCSFASPTGLLRWLKAKSTQAWKAPLVIDADVLIAPQSQTQEPPDYQTKIREICSIHDDEEGRLRYGLGWPHVKELAQIEKKLRYTNIPVELETDRSALLEALWDRHPDTAHEIGAPNPRKSLEVKIDQVQDTMHEIVTKIANPKEKQQARRAEKDKQEMDRLLRKSPPENVRRFIPSLTKIEANVFTLSVGHEWDVPKIARAMNRDRKTIWETLRRANTKLDGVKSLPRTSKTIAADEERRRIEQKMNDGIDKP